MSTYSAIVRPLVVVEGSTTGSSSVSMEDIAWKVCSLVRGKGLVVLDEEEFER